PVPRPEKRGAGEIARAAGGFWPGPARRLDDQRGNEGAGTVRESASAVPLRKRKQRVRCRPKGVGPAQESAVPGPGEVGDNGRGAQGHRRAKPLATLEPDAHAGDERGPEGAGRAQELTNPGPWRSPDDGRGAEGAGRAQEPASARPGAEPAANRRRVE